MNTRSMMADEQYLRRRSVLQTHDRYLEGNKIKRSNLKSLFEILMIDSKFRSLSDIRLLKDILSDLQVMKKIQDHSQFDYICRELSLIKVKNGQFVFQRSRAKLYIILQGKIGIYNRESMESQLDQVITLHSSDCFGELIQTSNQLTDSVVALSLDDSVLAVITEESYKKFEQLGNYEMNAIQECIRDFKPFYKLSEDDINHIIKKANITKIPSNTVVIKEGQIPKALYLVRKGILKVFRSVKFIKQYENREKLNTFTHANKTFGIKQLTGGDYFPLKHLKTHSQFPFTIVSICPCELVLIPYRQIESYLPKIDTIENKEIGDNQIREKFVFNERWKKYKQTYLNMIVSDIDNRARATINRLPLKRKQSMDTLYLDLIKQ